MGNLEQIAGLSQACTGGADRPSPSMALALIASFGSEQRWAGDFAAAGSVPGNGAGWRVLELLAA